MDKRAIGIFLTSAETFKPSTMPQTSLGPPAPPASMAPPATRTLADTPQSRPDVPSRAQHATPPSPWKSGSATNRQGGMEVNVPPRVLWAFLSDVTNLAGVHEPVYRVEVLEDSRAGGEGADVRITRWVQHADWGPRL